MSLMAGFDMVIEISNDTIIKLLQNNLQIGGAPVQPPFEITVPIANGGVSGFAHMVITEVLLDLNADDTATLTHAFDRGSVVATSPIVKTVCPLDGLIKVRVPLQLGSAGGSGLAVTIGIPNSIVMLDFSPGALQKITKDLFGTPVTKQQFMDLASQSLTTYVHSIPALPLPLGFPVTPGINGSLTPALVFERLEVHCIPNDKRNLQTLGFFGILLAANDSNGDHTKRTGTAITASNDIAVSLSPQALHTLAFCPGMAVALKTNVAGLPTSCGSSAGISTQGVVVTSLVDTFGNGHIHLTGTAQKSGFCYDASAFFHATLALSVVGGMLTPNVVLDEPEIEVDIPWYCWLVSAVVGGPIAIAIASAVDLIANTVAPGLAVAAIKSALGSGLPSLGTGSLPAGVLTGVSITTEGLTLQGTIPISVGSPFISQALSLDGSVTTSDSSIITSGIYHTQVCAQLPAKDYPYTEYLQKQQGSYVLSGKLLIEPLTPQFTISNLGPDVPLTGQSGTVAIPNVKTYYPMPLATGGTDVVQTVHIGYQISGNTIQLTNTPEEGIYSFFLQVQASDCTGNLVTDENGKELQTALFVQFEGHHLYIGGGYEADQQFCHMLLAKQIRSITNDYKIWQRVPKYVEVNYPSPEKLIPYIRDIFALGIPQADAMVRAVRIVHGNSFYRAILSPVAKQPSLVGVKAISGSTSK